MCQLKTYLNLCIELNLQIILASLMYLTQLRGAAALTMILVYIMGDDL